MLFASDCKLIISHLKKRHRRNGFIDSVEFQLHYISYYSMTFDCYRFYREKKESNKPSEM